MLAFCKFHHGWTESKKHLSVYCAAHLQPLVRCIYISDNEQKGRGTESRTHFMLKSGQNNSSARFPHVCRTWQIIRPCEERILFSQKKAFKILFLCFSVLASVVYPLPSFTAFTYLSKYVLLSSPNSPFLSASPAHFRQLEESSVWSIYEGQVYLYHKTMRCLPLALKGYRDPWPFWTERAWTRAVYTPRMGRGLYLWPLNRCRLIKVRDGGQIVLESGLCFESCA